MSAIEEGRFLPFSIALKLPVEIPVCFSISGPEMCRSEERRVRKECRWGWWGCG